MTIFVFTRMLYEVRLYHGDKDSKLLLKIISL